MYTNTIMAKRANGVGKMKTTRSHKTAKRLAVKKEMLIVKSAKRNNRNFGKTLV